MEWRDFVGTQVVSADSAPDDGVRPDPVIDPGTVMLEKLASLNLCPISLLAFCRMLILMSDF